MKKVYKYVFLFILTVFSFFYASKVSDLIIDKSELMQTIKVNKINYEISPVDAVIFNNEIIPGLNGIIINESESYSKMKQKSVFDKAKLVTIDVKPIISVDDNKTLVIIRGNPLKRAVAIITFNTNIIKYAKQNNIKINNYENEVCYKEFCKNKFNVKESLIINNEVKNIEAGDIIFISNNTTIKTFETLLNKIKHQDLQIIYLTELISEKRS